MADSKLVLVARAHYLSPSQVELKLKNDGATDGRMVRRIGGELHIRLERT